MGWSLLELASWLRSLVEMKVKVTAAVLLSLVVVSQCQFLPDPTEEQIECFNETTTAEANEFQSACEDVLSGPPMTDVRRYEPFRFSHHCVP